MTADDEEARKATLRALILADSHRLEILQCAERLQRECALPDALLAAGFVRNCYWDQLHGFDASPLSDVDLIYFDPSNMQPSSDRLLQLRLVEYLPSVNWEVKNQVRMQIRHGDIAYQDSVHAMSFWPECETAVGIRLDGTREIVSAFPLGGLFAGDITPGPKRERALCEQRVQQKAWLQRWPKLRLI